MQKIIIEPIKELDYKTSEEIKRLRTVINFIESDKMVINITSTVGREGKSFISFWLAHSLADLGKKVILIDGNIRSKDKHDIFTVDIKLNNIKNDKKTVEQDVIDKNYMKYDGLTDYLVQKARKEEITYNTNISNLDIILSGRISLNPSELLSNFLLRDLIKYLRENYDYVIVDTPALGEVTDALIIASHCDRSILVIEPEVTSYKLAQKALEQINNSGTELLGVVLNKA